MLRASIDKRPESWPERLPALLAAYRMTPHSVTGTSPNMAMLGRETLLPASLIVQLRTLYTFCGGISQKKCAMRMHQFAARPAALRNLKNNILTGTSRLPSSKSAYWPRLLLRHRLRKLTRSWTRPWRIVEFKTSIVVVVQNVKTNKKQTVHVDRLVPCHSRLHDEAEETPVPTPARPRRSSRQPARLRDYDLR